MRNGLRGGPHAASPRILPRNCPRRPGFSAAVRRFCSISTVMRRSRLSPPHHRDPLPEACCSRSRGLLPFSERQGTAAANRHCSRWRCLPPGVLLNSSPAFHSVRCPSAPCAVSSSWAMRVTRILPPCFPGRSSATACDSAFFAAPSSVPVRRSTGSITILTGSLRNANDASDPCLHFRNGGGKFS